MTAADGAEISARFYAAQGSARGAVVVANAMGVTQKFYARLAQWLARQGYHVLTFDYRGTGDSRRGPLRSLDADIFTWAEKDASAALRQIQTLAPGLPVTWVGHSLGGQILPFVEGLEGIARVITVAAGSGYWLENALPTRRVVWFFWFFAVPLGTRLFGYFPGAALKMVGDLPKGVVLQWRRWCLNRDYVLGVEPGARDRFAAIAAPIVSLSFTDDHMMSERNTQALHAAFSAAPLKLQRYSPKELGLDQVGHFGFFREPSLWERLLLPALTPS